MSQTKDLEKIEEQAVTGNEEHLADRLISSQGASLSIPSSRDVISNCVKVVVIVRLVKNHPQVYPLFKVKKLPDS